MAEDILQQKKEEVATVYLKDLKEELGFLKGSIVGMFGSKLKEMMTSDEAMGETFDTSKLNFFEKMLVNISPSTAEKVFTFVKEKQEKIQMAKTDSELDALKAGITVTPTTTTTTTEETPKTETTTETAPTTTETLEMTADDIKKRNAAITSSIKNAKAFPVTIDYGTDKDVLEKKGCPTTIDFDASSQSIKIGDAKLKINVGTFTTQTSFGEAEVKSVTVNDITFKDDAFSLNVTGKGTLTGLIPVSKTDTQDIFVTKEQLLQMVEPYYKDNKTEYDVTLEDGEGNTVPVEVEKTSGDLMTTPIAATAVTGGATTTTEETEETASTETTEEEEEEEEETTKKKDKNANIETGLAVGGGLGLGVLATDKIYKLQEARKIENTIDLKTPEQFAAKMKTQFEDLSAQLTREAANNNKLTQFQAKALSKSAKEFEKVAKDMDEGTLDAVGMLGKLDRKLPASILKTIDPSQAKNLMKLTEADFALIKAGKEVDAIQGLNKEVVTVLKSADNVDEMMSMAKVLTKSKGVSGFLKGIKGVAFLDLISTGFDVWVLCEGLDEAEAYKKLNEVRSTTKSEHQRVQFGVSVALTAVGIIATCAAAGSVVPGLGTAVGAAIGVIGYAASQAIDIYYDKVEFYLQNEEDFKRQYRTEIKQAIIQSAAAEEWNLNMSERLEASSAKAGTNRAERHLVPFGILLFDTDKLTTTEDAWKALIRQEEYKKKEYPMIQEGFASDKTESEYIKTLSEEKKKEFETQKKALNSVINKRLEYVKLFMYENKTTKEYQGFVSAMKSGLGVKKIEKILAESKTYYDMKQTGEDQYVTGAKTIEEYKTSYETKLKQTDAEKFATLETMREKEQYKFLEIYYGVENFESILDNQKKAAEKETITEETPTEETPTTEGEEKATTETTETGAGTEEKTEEIDAATLATMEANIDFIKKFYEYKMMSLPIEEQKKLELSTRIIDNKNIENMLKTGDFDVVNLFKDENVKRYFTNHGILDRMETKVEVSDSVGQNIIYRIATEIHGYTGNNDMKDLIAFFSMGKENATGLYYDDKRIVNNDRAIDKGIDIDQFESMTEEEIIKERTRSNNRNAIFEIAIDPSPLKFMGVSVGGFMDSASMIDTPTEDMDDTLNKEYRTRVKEIIYQEKGYSKPENKKLVEQAIVTYVTDNVKDSGYIELPYYLIIAAKKAKIGDLQKYLFSNKDGKITACTTKLYLDDKLDFSETKTDIQKEYISGMKEGLSESADLYIEYVDKAKEKFEALITYDVDELDIPKEYLEIYQAKITEWDTLKQSLSVLDPVTAKGELEMKYQEYHDYFENTYIAMLEVISKFKTNIFSSNDLDSATYHQQIEYIAAQLSTITITKDGEIKIPKDQLTEKQLEAYNRLIKSQHIKGKSIKELASSKKEEDQKKAIWGVKQIIKSILEIQMLDFDEQGEITGIEHGEQAEELMELMKGDTVKERLKLNMADKEYFDASQYTITTEKTDESKIEIKALTESEEKTTEASNEVEKIIKETEPDLVYPGRGLVTFDPETNVLKSRSEDITIDPQTLKIKGLDTKFADVKELIMAANLMNRFKYKYPGQKDFYFGSGTMLGGYYGIYKPVDRGMDDRILTLDAIKEKFPSMLDSNNDVTSDVMSYINSIT